MLTDMGMTPIGRLFAEIEDGALLALKFDPEPGKAESVASCEDLTAADRSVYEAVKRWLDSYFSGRIPPPDEISLFLRGSAFQLLVWDELRKISKGETVSYGEIARRIERKTGKRVSARAVGGAVGRNPIPILLPCHRVIGADGSLTGFTGGLDKKIKLLEHEGFIIKDGRVAQS